MNLPRFLIVCVLGMVTVLYGRSPIFGQVETLEPQETSASADDKATNNVVLVINFGNHFEKHYTGLEWKPKLTVFDAMQQARAHDHGVEFAARGKGETAFLESIDGLENQGNGGSNWIYSVNGERADRSFGTKILQDGDTVLWSFEK